jgi:hypothetical protein
LHRPYNPARCGAAALLTAIMAAALAALKRYWGFSAFRPAQESVIDAVLAGRDALVIMATGSGKSLWCAAARCSAGSFGAREDEECSLRGAPPLARRAQLPTPATGERQGVHRRLAAHLADAGPGAASRAALTRPQALSR